MSENNYSYFTEPTLQQDYAQSITPFWQQCVSQGRFTGQGDIQVHYAYCVPESAHASVVISSGRIESLLKYQEVIYDLYHQGFAVFILDHRGQGLSGRMRDNPHLGFVNHFDEYVADMQHFLNEVVIPNQQGSLNLLCHSMGSAIGALTVLSMPKVFSRVVFCAPMFGIRPAMPQWLASTLITVNRLYNACVPGASGYFFGQRNYHEEPFATNRLTGSEARYKLFRELYTLQPEIQLGGVTPEWLAAASAAMWQIEQHASELTLPVTVFSAERDGVVDNQRQQRVVSNMPNANWVSVAGAKHEILIEQDAIRTPVMRQIVSFFNSDL
ncbi:lysophospholipase [Marisediminitalea aggregata]|uniref:Lysophospholipase n=1 Tax=Marisediminitalea aggregata TaxID=634436 RepID=A0A1M5NYE7_9ALTE|nr:alpha/beta fold hydrolase [Marisediminitalea aggregata]SHG94219.1 lysophospholipase [Marisediminitalea aggregata]